MNYFKKIPAKILDNSNLRDPQKFAYGQALNHYEIGKSKIKETMIVLPTGVGKTGVIATLPFGISDGRVLILTPQLTIKDGILKSLTTGVDNFYRKFEVLENYFNYPQVAEFKKGIPLSIYDECHIIIANIHKAQDRLEKSMTKMLPKDYFDMIIIDEAHHSVAKTWVDTIKYFDAKKIIKLTATPFRTDGEAIVGKEIYNYPLSSAMSNSYIKSLENITYIPEKLYLTIDGNSDKKYTVNEILELKLKDDEWISRSVAYSRECSEQIVEKSIELLLEKKQASSIPHKIIAIACSVEHAEQIKEIYEEKGMKVAIIHSKLGDSEKEANFKNIENHRVDVVLNVAMLGEGYDHKYLSIAAIFRPFRNILPYTQFIGRILRFISESSNPIDNIGRIIAHESLNLGELWEYYRAEIEKSNIANKLKENYEETEKIIKLYEGKEKKIEQKDIGSAFEEGIATLKVDKYLETELTKKVEERKKEEEEKIKKIQEIMDFDYETAKIFYQAGEARKETNGLNRPDLVFLNTKQLFDSRIKEEVIPSILEKTKHELHTKTLSSSKLFNRKYRWLVNEGSNNGGILAVFISIKLNEKIGKKREEWEDSDFVVATNYLKELQKFLEETINL